NSGIFVFQASQFLKALKLYAPAIYSACEQAMVKAQIDVDFIRPDPKSFLISPGISIDYAVMEKTDQGYVIPFDGGWNDIGSWAALWDLSEKDQAGNVLIGDVLAENTKNSYVHANSRCVATVG